MGTVNGNGTSRSPRGRRRVMRVRGGRATAREPDADGVRGRSPRDVVRDMRHHGETRDRAEVLFEAPNGEQYCEIQGDVTLTVTFYGVRGSTPCPCEANLRYGGNTACVALEAPGCEPIVLDLGTGLRYWGDTLP